MNLISARFDRFVPREVAGSCSTFASAGGLEGLVDVFRAPGERLRQTRLGLAIYELAGGRAAGGLEGPRTYT